MVGVFRRLSSLLGGVAVAGAMIAATPGGVSADGATTCQGGSIAGGSYSSLAVAGVCAMDSGNVRVTGNLTVQPGGVLVAIFSGSNVEVRGNLNVGSGGMLLLGCEPFAFPCANDPNAGTGGTLSASAKIGGSLVAENSLAALVHNTWVGRNLVLNGGGGGVGCAPNPILSSLSGFPLPPYATFEDVTVAGNASISGWRSCWLGFFRNTVAGNVNFNNNVNADPDANEVATNTIHGNLNCELNTPAPQVGDSGGLPNNVSGKANGQCAALAAPHV